MLKIILNLIGSVFRSRQTIATEEAFSHADGIMRRDSKLSGVILLNDLALAAERISRPADNGISHADVMGVLKAVSGSG